MVTSAIRYSSANSAAATQTTQSVNDATIVDQPRASSAPNTARFGSLASSPAIGQSASAGIAAPSEVAKSKSATEPMAETGDGVASEPDGRGAGSGPEVNGATFSHH